MGFGCIITVVILDGIEVDIIERGGEGVKFR